MVVVAISLSSLRQLTAEEIAQVRQWLPPQLLDRTAPSAPEPATPEPGDRGSLDPLAETPGPVPEPEDVPQAEARPPTAEELEAIQQQAYAEGFERGREQGFQLGHREALEEGRRQATERRDRLDQLLATLETPFKDLDSQVEQELLTLVVTMVRHLVRREIRTDPQQIIGVVREAMAILPVSSRNVRLKLHPEDAEIVRQLYAKGDGGRSWNIEEDPALQRGGCRIVTETSQVDASLDSRLNNLIAPLLSGLRNEDQADD